MKKLIVLTLALFVFTNCSKDKDPVITLIGLWAYESHDCGETTWGAIEFRQSDFISDSDTIGYIQVNDTIIRTRDDQRIFEILELTEDRLILEFLFFSGGCELRYRKNE